MGSEMCIRDSVDDVAKSIFSAYDTSPGATVEEIVIRPQLGDI